MKRCEEYRLLRIQLGTQSEVAAMIGITVNALSDREMGHTDDIRIESFLALQMLILMRVRKRATGRVRTV